MITGVTAISFAVGGALTLLAQRLRMRQLTRSSLSHEEQRGAEALDQLDQALRARHKRAVDKLKRRAKQSQARDERRAEELTHDEAQLHEQGAHLDEREERQRERSDALSARQEDNKARGAVVKEQKSTLKAQRDTSLLKLEERAEVTCEVLGEQLKERRFAEAEVNAQRASQQRIVKAEAYASQSAAQLLRLSCQRYYDPRPAERLQGYVALPRSSAKRQAILDPSASLISALSEVTGVEFCLEPNHEDRLMLRNAPETFSREVARATFDRWVQGGQLSEASLATHHRKALAQLERRCHEGGQAAARRLGIKGVNPEILYLVGKLLFRTSYTQNQWTHAIEAADICGMMAEELGIDPTLARRATLLHDIGKVLWEQTEEVGSHAVSGGAFARDHGEIEEVIHPIAAHHHDEAPSSALAYLVIAADTLSGARPGARRETSEAFSQHVEQLEGICAQVPHLRHHMVIQGGREVRLQLHEQRYSDLQVARLTEELAHSIEDECVFPGQVKVTALRQVITNATAYARRSSPRDQAQHINTIKTLGERLTGRPWRGGEVGR